MRFLSWFAACRDKNDCVGTTSFKDDFQMQAGPRRDSDCRVRLEFRAWQPARSIQAGLTCFCNQIEYDDRILDIEVRQMIATTAHAMMAHRDSKELSAPFVATVDSRTLHGLLKLHIRSFKFARLDSMRRTLLNQDGSFPRRAPAGHCEPVAATPRRPKLQAVKENTH